ncbi:DUF1294 domain-containing protein [Pseudophaeobacter flagellatus]|uniref:DUF1294 domain-containing protein n=1 Tax=Pseudophaeobacter flagellatus TaxID=2899119 RepID=UPI001E6005E2|nr:DUF1294 domain-containing protein [Pseudophaeobacter flagellatus]MCD9147311.1 DUF1294 domain-containing protein [Pseudophaeobacter flagellatus]
MQSEFWAWALPCLLAINGLSFIAFGLDKFCAKYGFWRVPEARLLLLAALGGSPAAYLARWLFRHKTRKQPFCRRLNMIAGAQLLLPLIWVLGFT